MGKQQTGISLTDASVDYSFRARKCYIPDPEVVNSNPSQVQLSVHRVSSMKLDLKKVSQTSKTFSVVPTEQHYTSQLTQHKKATIHQLTSMLATSKNFLFPGHNHLLTTGADDLTL